MVSVTLLRSPISGTWLTFTDTQPSVTRDTLVTCHEACYMFQIHSITARTVPLEFRESLRRGKPVHTDSILRTLDSPD